MERFARTMIRFRWLVLGGWIAVIVASAVVSSGLNDLLTNRFVLPGAESEKAGDILKDHFGQQPDGSFTVVVKGKPGSAQSLIEPTRAAATRAAAALKSGKLADVRPAAGDVVTAQIVSQLQPADAKAYTGAMRKAAGSIPGATLYVTGQSAIEHDLEPVQNRDLFVGELLIAIPVALLILVFVFGTLAFLLPFMLAAAAIPTTLAFDRVRLIPKRVIERRESSDSNFWARLANTIMRRPAVFAAGTVAVLLLLASPVMALQLGPGSNEGVPQDLEAVQGLNVLSDAVGEGALAPTDIVIDTKRPGGTKDPAVLAGVERLTGQLRGDSEVADVIASGPQTVDSTGRYMHIQAIGKHEYGLPESQEFVDRLRDVIVPAAAFPASAEVLAGGGPSFGVDFLDMTYGAFPWLVVAVLLLTYILLVRAFRSLLLPLKAIVLNMLSIGAASGILVLAFKLGAGEPFGLTQFDQIEGWIPVFLFAMLFGLSMDYEVFLVTRMREEWDASRDNRAAVVQGLAKTGRLVTAAGLIMFAAFMGFVAGSIVGLQQFGLGLAAAILIDVTIIRALLVPSAMKIFGRWNWWLPESAARIFRVEPSPLHETPARAVTPAGR